MQVSRDTQGAEQVVRISLERHGDELGWYTAGSMCIPLCQLPVLEQALDELSASQSFPCTEGIGGRKIIPFPLLAQSVSEELATKIAN